ncbi:hypothetical protein [Lederbergia lenta]|uniref:hypothetical protein n=1 Tax=Lederbergia lenta TaxID=1467 RepID=UPI0008244176|nr:hypothetical protein [Lederbergia lenta]MEC2323619.1 hypothetical protein [Lederbergia lenta]
MEIETVVGDTDYSGKENLLYMKEQEIQLVSKLHPVITTGQPHRKKDLNLTKMQILMRVPHSDLA